MKKKAKWNRLLDHLIEELKDHNLDDIERACAGLLIYRMNSDLKQGHYSDGVLHFLMDFTTLASQLGMEITSEIQDDVSH